MKVASLNVNSLLKHIDEIRLMLSNHVFDILAINESKIDPSIPDSEINIPSYKSIRKDRNRNGGGVVIYVREQISFRDRNDLVSDGLEMICIEIERPHSKPFLPQNRDYNRSPTSVGTFDVNGAAHAAQEKQKKKN